MKTYTSDTNIDTEITHTYSTPGTYQVSITGNLEGLSFNGAGDSDKIVSIDQWGSIAWTSLFASFATCSNLDLLAIDIPDLSNVNSLVGMFSDCTSLVGNESIGLWQTSTITDTSSMFEDCPLFNQDISNWNMSNVERMVAMFVRAESFNQAIGKWDVGNVTNMLAMFVDAQAFDQDLGNWDISNVTDMTSMLTNVTLSTSNYDSLLRGWASLPTLQSNIEFDAGNSQYCSAQFERQAIVDTYGWTITDAGAGSNCPFVTTWKTDNPGITGNNQITIPTFPGETYNYKVNWGDGTSDTDVTGDIVHTYATPGTYKVSISGDFPRIYHDVSDGFETTDSQKLVSVDGWGSQVWSSMAFAFAGCTNMDILATDIPDLSEVTSMQNTFTYCFALKGNESIGSWDVSNVTDMSNLFFSNYLFNQDVGNWNVSNLIEATGIFFEAQSFDQDISGWNVSNVQFMGSMFDGATVFNQDISSWDVSNVTNFNNTFARTNVFNQDLSNWNVGNVIIFSGAFAFDQDLSSWNVSSAIRMEFMFDGATNFNQNIGAWNVERVTSMQAMFRNALAFNQDIGNWNVSSVADMSSMFEGTMDFDQDLGDWDVSSVTTMEDMFTNNALSTDNYDNTLIGWYQLPSLQNNVIFDGGFSQYCNSVVERLKLMYEKDWTINDEGLTAGFCAERPFITTWKTDNPGVSENNQITIPTFVGETYNYNVDWGDGNSDSNVTGDITHTYASPGTFDISITGDFPQIYFVNQGDKEKILLVKQWGDIEWSSMLNAFHGCSNLDVVADDIPDLTNVGNTQYMFRLCSELNGNEAFKVWDLSGVTNMDFMFRQATKFNQDISGWDTSQVMGMRGLFLDAKAFNQNIGNWNVQNVLDMERMFNGAETFNQDLSTWSTSNVGNMFGMFFLAGAFNGNIADWDVSSVTNMSVMFADARAFNQDISGWNVSNVTEMGQTFDSATSFNQNLNGWDVSNVTNMARMFMNATSFNGNISNWDVSNVVAMGNMFNNVATFNQDISGWNVSSVTDMAGMLAGAMTFDQDLGNWNVSNVTDMTSMLFDVSLSTANYDSLLEGWASLPNLQSGVVFDAGNSQYCAAGEARQSILDSYGWTITDGGANTECFFITTWKTDNAGVSEDNQITIPTFPGETYDYFVDWGDGTSGANVTGDVTHTYASPGTYQVSITGNFPHMYFNDSGDKSKIVSVDQWGGIIWSSMDNAFWGCHNMDMDASDVPDLSNVTSMRFMFKDCASLIGDGIGNWDVSTIEDFSNLFDNATIFNQDLNDWDVSNVRNMNAVFDTANNFNGNISNWNVSNVIFMSNMFRQASAFNQDISAWDVSQVSLFTDMFNSATVFNQDIGNWNVGSGRIFGGMFASTDFFDQDISNWDLSNAENISAMFFQAIKFNQEIGNWDVSNITSMNSIFSRAESFNGNLSNWDVSNVTSMIAMFANASTFNQDIGNWNVSNVSDMTDMFFEAGLSTENYDKTLDGWSSLPSLQNDVFFSAGNSQFCESADARQSIIDTYGWTILDAGEAPLCNEDNDADGVLDYKDACLDSAPGAIVNENGCDVIANDAIQILALTPSCTDSSDGSIEVSMNATGYLLDISIEGGGIVNQFDDVTSGTQFEINDLPVGAYTVTISIPEILFERTFGVTVNSLESVSGKRQVLDARARAVSYLVTGSKNYTVSVNGENRPFQFEDSGPQTIFVENLDGETEIIITGENDCQGKFEDSFFVEDSISVFPTVVLDNFSVISGSRNIELVIYSLGGRVVQPLQSLEFSNREAEVDISLLPSGLYLVNLVEGKNVKTVKIIKR